MNYEASACAGGPSPPASSSLTRALSLCRPAGLNVDGGRGLRARYLGADGDGGHLGYLRLELRTSLLQLFAVEVAERSEGVASVRPEIAAEAALAWVGRLWRYSVLCGWTGDVVGRLAPLRYVYEKSKNLGGASRKRQHRSQPSLSTGFGEKAQCDFFRATE